MLKRAIDNMNSKGYKFMVACETDKGRYFRSFYDQKTYYKSIKYCNNAHEVIIGDRGGRIVFDFDIKVDIPDEPVFKQKIEMLIRRTLMKHYRSNIDLRRLRYVWLHSPNENKTSKHLIVKHGYFVRRWAAQLKQFYKLFKKEYEAEPFDWISSDDLIDHQVARKNGSMRMPLNSKLGGSKMIFDEPNKFKFFDGLIQPLQPSLEQQIPLYDIPIKVKTCVTHCSSDIQIPESLIPKGFKLGKKDGNIVQLIRTCSSECPISGRVHDSDNACLILNGNNIIFYCYRDKECLQLTKENPTTNECYEMLKDLKH